MISIYSLIPIFIKKQNQISKKDKRNEPLSFGHQITKVHFYYGKLTKENHG